MQTQNPVWIITLWNQPTGQGLADSYYGVIITHDLFDALYQLAQSHNINMQALPEFFDMKFEQLGHGTRLVRP